MDRVKGTPEHPSVHQTSQLAIQVDIRRSIFYLGQYSAPQFPAVNRSQKQYLCFP